MIKLCMLGSGHGCCFRWEWWKTTRISACLATVVQFFVTSLDLVFAKTNCWSKCSVTDLYCYASLHILSGYREILELSRWVWSFQGGSQYSGCFIFNFFKSKQSTQLSFSFFQDVQVCKKYLFLHLNFRL